MLENHHWPGNVRELQNIIERAIVLSETGILLPADFPTYLHKAGIGGPESRLKELQASSDREALKAALIKTGGDCIAAGRIIGESKATVYRWVDEFGLSDLLKRPRR